MISDAGNAQSGLVPCPECGNTTGRPIAPNYVECLGIIRWQETQVVLVGMIPNGPHPMYGERPLYDNIVHQRERTCGVRHHQPMTGTTLPQCACGTFAIGLCAQCKSPVCGDDSGRLDASRLCFQCLHKRQAETAALAARRASEARSAQEVRRCEQSGRPGGPCGHDVAQLAPDGRCWICNPR